MTKNYLFTIFIAAAVALSVSFFTNGNLNERIAKLIPAPLADKVVDTFGGFSFGSETGLDALTLTGGLTVGTAKGSFATTTIGSGSKGGEFSVGGLTRHVYQKACLSTDDTTEFAILRYGNATSTAWASIAITTPTTTRSFFNVGTSSPLDASTSLHKQRGGIIGGGMIVANQTGTIYSGFRGASIGSGVSAATTTVTWPIVVLPTDTIYFFGTSTESTDINVADFVSIQGFGGSWAATCTVILETVF